MKRKLLTSILSLVLVITIGFSYPLQISAIGNEDTTEAAIIADDTYDNYPGYDEEPADDEAEVSEPKADELAAEILYEETEKRDMYTKYFRLENGSYIAASYDYPVHFKADNGEWTDFDNTLVDAPVEDEISEDSEFEAQTIEAESPDLNIQPSSAAEEESIENEAPSEENLNLNTDNTTSLESSDEPENISADVAEQSDETESYKIEQSDKTELKNKNSNVEVRLSRKAKKNNMVKVKFDGYKISWGYPEISASAAKNCRK